MKSLLKLGFRPKQKTPTQRFFESRKLHAPVTPETDYQPGAERVPQARNFAALWLDHFTNVYGNVRNPLGSPMESGA